MPINTISANTRKVAFLASAGQTIFPFSFPVYSADYLYVLRRRGETNEILSLNVDYSVSGVQEQTGGTVTLSVGAQADDLIFIAGNQAIERASDYKDGGAFNERSINGDLNRLLISLQEIATRQDRVLQLPFNELPIDVMRLPPFADRRNRLLGFDNDGLPVAVSPPGDPFPLPDSEQAWKPVIHVPFANVLGITQDLPANLRLFRITMYAVAMSATAHILYRKSTNGSTFISGATNYFWCELGTGDANNVFGLNSVFSSAMRVSGAIPVGRKQNIIKMTYYPGDTTTTDLMGTEFEGVGQLPAGPVYSIFKTAGACNDDVGRAQTIAFFPSAGGVLMSGSMLVEGMV